MMKKYLVEHSFEEMNGFMAKLFADWTKYAAVHAAQEDRIKMLIGFEEIKEFLELSEQNNEA